MGTYRLPLAVLVMVALFLGSCGGTSDGGGGGGTMVPAITQADIDYALTALNAMRAMECPGCAPLVRDAGLDAYAMAANDEFDTTRLEHSYFMANPIGPFCPVPLPPAAMGGPAAENEGLAGVGLSNMASIDGILGFYLAERDMYPPGHPDRGHYEAIINPGFNSVGIAIKRSAIDGFFVMSQEFCD